MKEVETKYFTKAKFLGDWHLPFLLRQGRVFSLTYVCLINSLVCYLVFHNDLRFGAFAYCLTFIFTWTVGLLLIFKSSKETSNAKLIFDDNNKVVSLFDYRSSNLLMFGGENSTVIEKSKEIWLYKNPLLLFRIPKLELEKDVQYNVLNTLPKNISWDHHKIFTYVFQFFIPILCFILVNQIWLSIFLQTSL